MTIDVREATSSDSGGITEAILAAFPGADGREVSDLTSALLSDPSAAPRISLVAEVNSRIVGHILFTSVTLEKSPVEVSAQILAPLSVHPDFQRRGIGGRLIEEGVKEAGKAGIALVFVLGHPEYYRRHGFSVAGINGYEAPYPIPAKNAAAWMVMELENGKLQECSGRVKCAAPLMDPRHWHE